MNIEFNLILFCYFCSVHRWKWNILMSRSKDELHFVNDTYCIDTPIKYNYNPKCPYNSNTVCSTSVVISCNFRNMIFFIYYSFYLLVKILNKKDVIIEAYLFVWNDLISTKLASELGGFYSAIKKHMHISQRFQTNVPKSYNIFFFIVFRSSSFMFSQVLINDF